MTELGLEIVEISARGDRVVTVDRNHTKLALYEIKIQKSSRNGDRCQHYLCTLSGEVRECEAARPNIGHLTAEEGTNFGPDTRRGIIAPEFGEVSHNVVAREKGFDTRVC